MSIDLFRNQSINQLVSKRGSDCAHYWLPLVKVKQNGTEEWCLFLAPEIRVTWYTRFRIESIMAFDNIIT